MLIHLILKKEKRDSALLPGTSIPSKVDKDWIIRFSKNMENGGNDANEWTISMQVSELKKLKETSSGPTIFAPQSSSIQKLESSNSDSVLPTRPAACVPEKKLTVFALRLAVLEKAATRLGTLGFIWATVVLLGGFAITLDKTDFWLITIILLIEGTRIFSRSHELEWQHQATWSVADAGINSFRVLKTTSRSIVENMQLAFKPFSALRNRSPKFGDIALAHHKDVRDRYVDDQRMPWQTWGNADVPLLPYAPWVFISRNISRILYWLQLLSATACIVLSVMRLIKHNYGEVQKGDTDRRNRKAALTIFYSLALAEAMLFLLEKAYWEWNVIYCELLEKVNMECELGSSGMISVRRFFYDAYSRCVNGSIFDGLKMDMVTFAMDLLASNSPDEQLIGARLLRQFATNQLFSDATLQKIGISIQVIERLVEMLNWKDSREEEIRRSAAEILSKVAGKKQNSLRVAEIPGAMESISSLLQTNRNFTVAADEISEKFDHENYSFWTFNHLGLLILKKLSRDHDNCGKIGNARGLLPKIIDFTHAEEKLLKDPTVTPSQILTVKRSLQLVKMLASTAGTAGKHIRKEISEIVFTISNIRDILRLGERQPILQKLGIEILTSLALEEDATEKIGSTGGVLKQLFILLFKHDAQQNQNHVRMAAGEALGMLALDSKANCQRILKLGVLDNLVKALQVPLLRISAARILRNLCTYAGKESYTSLCGITAAAPTVLKAILSEENKLQEVMVGLAVHIFKFMNLEESSGVFQRADIAEADLAYTVVCILKKHQYPPVRVPRIRRFAVDLAISMMMREKEENIRLFREFGLKDELHIVLETTAEIENFNIFSGTVGLNRHSTTIHSLVETALKLLQDK